MNHPMDLIIAQRIFKRNFNKAPEGFSAFPIRVPNYHDNLDDAWTVILELNKHGVMLWNLAQYIHVELDLTTYTCHLAWSESGELKNYAASAKTPSEAICQAALGVERELGLGIPKPPCYPSTTR